jgi:hypothetical protein
MVPFGTQAYAATPENIDICSRNSYLEQTLVLKAETSNFKSL